VINAFGLPLKPGVTNRDLIAVVSLSAAMRQLASSSIMAVWLVMSAAALLRESNAGENSSLLRMTSMASLSSLPS
jgi:hypothetical protein